MTNTANIQPQPSLGFGIEPLRAKWGWIVALGVVYLIVGVIALGSIILATAASVFLVGIMMVIAGVAENHQCVPDQDLGQVSSLACSGCALRFCRFCRVLKSVADCSRPDAVAWCGSRRFRYHAHRPRLTASSRCSWALSFWHAGRSRACMFSDFILGIDLVIAGASWMAIGLGLKQRA